MKWSETRARIPVAALLLALLPVLATALPEDSRQPITMEADGVEIDDGTGVSVYEGNVVVDQGSIHLTADRVVVTRKPNGANHIVASGNPTTFRQRVEGKREPIRGRSRKAEYDTDSEVVILIGDAVVTQGKDSFASDRIVYDRVRGQVRAGARAKGKQRVRVTIQPKDAQRK
ncbi:MAG TPA: lipopolysaccharide transport periplasmic protein LptA [Sedimenticola thiotaurini]|uniref:Lipopolysaccharide export system protein LptA n=1 Tax=Sedimenticola thiotaurini TaxID=1543721 RepID=A0A831RMH1_9GAMM|nr:lipopolysaccharide transport periplasmic protein LptA [Sedimenticola thiotaurini]